MCDIDILTHRSQLTEDHEVQFDCDCGKTVQKFQIPYQCVGGSVGEEGGSCRDWLPFSYSFIWLAEEDLHKSKALVNTKDYMDIA